jgi:hypothetical protein
VVIVEAVKMIKPMLTMWKEEELSEDVFATYICEFYSSGEQVIEIRKKFIDNDMDNVKINTLSSYEAYDQYTDELIEKHEYHVAKR